MAQATLHGTLVNDGGLPCDCCFEFGETIAYGTYTQWILGLRTGDVFMDVVYGLRYATVYYYRAVARNALGIATATGTTLTTPYILPQIATMPATGISPHKAVLNYYLENDMGSPCVVYFEYGLTKSYGLKSSKQPGVVSYDSGGIEVDSLGAGMPFHYRAVAENNRGAGYGEDRVFSTLSEFSPYSGLTMELVTLLEM